MRAWGGAVLWGGALWTGVLILGIGAFLEREGGFEWMGALLLVALSAAVLVGRLHHEEGEASQLREALREALRREDEVQAGSPEPVASLQEGGVLSRPNSAWKELLGQPPERLVGMTLSSLLHPGDRPRWEEALHQAWQEGRVPDPLEVRFLHEGLKEGRLGRLHLLPLWLGSHRPQSMLLWVKDLSREQEMKVQLVAGHQEALASLVARGLSHDFGNYLQSITASLGTGRRAARDASPEIRECLADIAEAVQLGQGLTTRLANLGRKRRGNGPAWTGVGSVIQHVRPLFQANLGDKVRLEVDIPSDLPDVAGDPGVLHQVLLNLLFNARDALGGEGEIRLTARARGDEVVLEVADDGRGIPEALLPRVFDTYVSTKGSGTGLGLVVVSHLVGTLGGRVGVRSRLGEGATFTVILPSRPSPRSLLAEPEVRDLPTPSSATPPRPRPEGGAIDGPGVLLVDDEVMLLRTLPKALAFLGVRMQAVPLVSDAVKVLEGGGIDVVLMDLSLSGGTPEKNFVTLREAAGGVPILVWSGNAASDAIPNLLSAGAAGFQEKTGDLTTLVDRLREVAGRARGGGPVSYSDTSR